MMVLAQLWFVLYALLKIALIIQNPSENCILNLLVILFLEKVIVEEHHRPHTEQLSSLQNNLKTG